MTERSSPSLSGRQVALIVISGFLPVVCAQIPGLADYPNHVARHHVFAAFGEGSPLARFFILQWRWIGNLGADLPSLVLAKWLGAELATRMVAAFILPMTIAGILAISQAVHGRISGSAVIALPLAAHHSYMWGFLNYSIGIALALLATASLIRRPSGPLVMALLAIGVCTAHIGGWIVLLALIAGIEIGKLRDWRGVGPAIARNWALLTPLLLIAISRGNDAGEAFAFDRDVIRSKIFAFVNMLRGVDIRLDLGLTAAMLLASLLAFCWAGKRRVDSGLFAGGCLLLVLTAATPSTVLGSWGADIRIAPVAVLTLILSITPAKDAVRERLLIAAGLILFAVRLGSVTWDWSTRSTLLSQRLTPLADLPEGSMLGFVYVEPDCHVRWRLDPGHKLASLAMVRRGVFTNSLFQVPGSDIMIIRDPRLREEWRDPAARILANCATGRPDVAAANTAVAKLARDGFDTIWITGLPYDQIIVPRSFRVSRPASGDVWLWRERP